MMNDGYGVWALLISLAYFATLGTQVQSNNVYPASSVEVTRLEAWLSKGRCGLPW